MSNDGALPTQADDLRRSFDQSFAEVERPARASFQRFLGLTIGDAAYAIRVNEVTSLAPVRKIVPVPSAQPELMGLCGHRGAVLPVFDLGALLGHGATERVRWLVLCGVPDVVALAVSLLDGQIEAPTSAVRPVRHPDDRKHTTALLEGNPVRRLISVESVLSAIANQGG
jgi:chemotaxis signal transduction protein